MIEKQDISLPENDITRLSKQELARKATAGLLVAKLMLVPAGAGVKAVHEQHKDTAQQVMSGEDVQASFLANVQEKLGGWSLVGSAEAAEIPPVTKEQLKQMMKVIFAQIELSMFLGGTDLQSSGLVYEIDQLSDEQVQKIVSRYNELVKERLDEQTQARILAALILAERGQPANAIDMLKGNPELDIMFDKNIAMEVPELVVELAKKDAEAEKKVNKMMQELDDLFKAQEELARSKEELARSKEELARSKEELESTKRVLKISREIGLFLKGKNNLTKQQVQEKIKIVEADMQKYPDNYTPEMLTQWKTIKFGLMLKTR